RRKPQAKPMQSPMRAQPLRRVCQIARSAVTDWFNDSAPRLGASIAFYSIFALAPLLVIAIAIAGAVFGEDAARGQIVAQIGGLVGTRAAQGLEQMIQSASLKQQSWFSSGVGLVTLLLGASGVFVEMQYAFDRIWGSEPRAGGLTLLVRARLMAIALVLGVGFLAIVSLLVSAAIHARGGYLFGTGPDVPAIMVGLDIVVSFALLTLAFAALLYFLPSGPVSWRAVLIGATTSALLFTLGKQLIGLYLGRASTTSSYGAAGSFVVVILWVYYSAQILLFGAEVGAVIEGKASRALDAQQHSA
ncbi:MAG TPA: YihY/virulence factor BrkB family protein, partial [Burkholderiales bacterium]|nr:YihY/virulence factor BrkB family protein [Burkholderiales bacterium]